MRDYKKIIHDDVDWLFFHYDLDMVDIEKSVEKDRMWDYVLKLRMGDRRDLFTGIRTNMDGAVDCVPPWTLAELFQSLTSKVKNE